MWCADVRAYVAPIPTNVSSILAHPARITDRRVPKLMRPNYFHTVRVACEFEYIEFIVYMREACVWSVWTRHSFSVRNDATKRTTYINMWTTKNTCAGFARHSRQRVIYGNLHFAQCELYADERIESHSNVKEKKTEQNPLMFASCVGSFSIPVATMWLTVEAIACEHRLTIANKYNRLECEIRFSETWHTDRIFILLWDADEIFIVTITTAFVVVCANLWHDI